MLENRPDQKESPTPVSTQTSQTKPSQQQANKSADVHDNTLKHNEPEPVQTPERGNASQQEDTSHQSRFKNLNLDDLSVDELNDIIDAFSKNKSPRRKRIWIIFALLLAAWLAYCAYNAFFASPQDTLTTNQFVEAVNQEQITKVVYKTQDSSITGVYTNSNDTSRHFKTYYIGHDSLQKLMQDHPTIAFSIDTSDDSMIKTVISAIVPTVLIVAALFFLMNSISDQNGRALSFGKARARVGEKKSPQNNF